MKAYSEIIRGIREDRDLKQYEIAQEIGTTQQHYSRYEKGENEMPIRVLMALADYYNVSTDYLLGRTICHEGVDGLSKPVTRECSVGMLVSQILALDNHAKEAVVEYVGLHAVKQRWDALQQK